MEVDDGMKKIYELTCDDLASAVHEWLINRGHEQKGRARLVQVVVHYDRDITKISVEVTK